MMFYGGSPTAAYLFVALLLLLLQCVQCSAADGQARLRSYCKCSCTLAANYYRSLELVRSCEECGVAQCLQRPAMANCTLEITTAECFGI
jgi:hypothetical protein